MVSRIYSSCVVGIDAYELTAEVDIGSGLPGFNIVGLPDMAIKESRDRIKAAIKNSGFSFPAKKIIVNLAPADIRKEGASFDLPIALAILSTEDVIDSSILQHHVFLGELSLDGRVKPVKGVRLDELFLRQLLKWQYPSPNHDDRDYTDSFCIKPFLEVLRMARELDGLTKYEIGLFCVPLIKHTDTEGVIEEIRTFRINLGELSTSAEKKRYIRAAFLERFRHIYANDIESGDIHIREGMTERTVEAFLNKKIRNARADYADSAIRYFRATGLFTISGSTYRLKIMDSKVNIVDDILRNVGREPESYEGNPSRFLDYLGNPNVPVIPQDNRSVIDDEIRTIFAEHESHHYEIVSDIRRKYDVRNTLALEALKNLRDEFDESLTLATLRNQRELLRDDSSLSNIFEVFEQIRDRENDDIPDKPLFFEWNAWRALSYLDDGEIKPNLQIDATGSPVRGALGGMPDIECYYRDFVLVTEVTISTGQRQYETEREPVPRHIGQVVRTLREAGDTRPVYGLFIAQTLNPSTVASFYGLRRETVIYYGGITKILPLSVDDFIEILKHAREMGRVTAEYIRKFIEWTFEEADRATDEEAWQASVRAGIKNWSTVSAE